MLRSVRKVVNLGLDSDKKRLLENFISLSVLQGANYILPLITLPYLVRVLGPEKFGLIAFAQAFVQYFNILTDYGFNLSATREISIHRENKKKISEIFSSVIIIKFALLILSFVIMTVIVFSFEKFKKDWLVYYLTFGIVVGQMLFPVWLFQGMEKMKYITFLNILAKLIFTVAIFVFVRKVSDYLYVPLINSLGFVMIGIFALWITFREFKIYLKLPSIAEIKDIFRKSWYIFLSNLSGNIYGQGTTFILGLVSSNFIVGYYSAAEKLVKAIASLSQPVAQSLYPYIVKLQMGDLFLNFRKVIVLSSVFAMLVTFLVFEKANSIICLLFGVGMKSSVIDLKILSIAMFFTMLNVVKQPYIYAIKRDRENFLMYLLIGLSFVPLCFFLSLYFKDIGTSISLIYVEVSVFIFGMFILKDLWRIRNG